MGRLLVGVFCAGAVAIGFFALTASGAEKQPEVTLSAQMTRVRVPNLRRLRPRVANRSLMRLHLRVGYTALSNLCAGIPPNGRILLQEPEAGTLVPRGSKVLLQTSCAPGVAH
jgi:beta-lactam-binding protein with PASTA domain